MADKRSTPTLGDATPATMLLASQALGRRNGITRKKRATRKRATKKRATTRRAAPKRRTKKKAKRLVKGSAAAKRHMARLRRMRKR